MLNNPGDELTDNEVTAEQPQPGPGATVLLSQVALILLAGLYLLGIVWLYVRLPWLALIVGVIAIVVAGLGAFATMNKRDAPPPA